MPTEGSVAEHQNVHFCISTHIEVGSCRTTDELRKQCGLHLEVDHRRVLLFSLQKLDDADENIEGKLVACQLSDSNLSIRDVERTMNEHRQLEYNLDRAANALIVLSHENEGDQNNDAKHVKQTEELHQVAVKRFQERIDMLERELQQTKKALLDYQTWRKASKSNINKLRQEFIELKMALKDANITN